MPSFYLPWTSPTAATTNAINLTTWVSWVDTVNANDTSITNYLSTYQNAVWTSWTTACTTLASSFGTAAGALRQLEQQVQDIQARHDRELERRSAAIIRARSVLDAHLTDEQRAQLARENFFVVRSQKNRLYRIYNGQAGNIRRVEEVPRPGSPDNCFRTVERERFCIHPRRHDVPDPDAMLLQKLMLETDEDQFLRVANQS